MYVDERIIKYTFITRLCTVFTWLRTRDSGWLLWILNSLKGGEFSWPAARLSPFRWFNLLFRIGAETNCVSRMFLKCVVPPFFFWVSGDNDLMNGTGLSRKLLWFVQGVKSATACTNWGKYSQYLVTGEYYKTQPFYVFRHISRRLSYRIWDHTILLTCSFLLVYSVV